jgi:hypothetical protein
MTSQLGRRVAVEFESPRPPEGTVTVSAAVMTPKTYRKRAPGPMPQASWWSRFQAFRDALAHRCFASLPEGVHRYASAVRSVPSEAT